MKKLLYIGVLLGALILTATDISRATVEAIHTGSVESISTNSVKAYSYPAPPGECVNYGHFTKTYNDFAPGGKIPTDFANLKADGITCIRIVLDNFFGNSATTTDLDLATTSVADGFYTIYGTTIGSPNISSSTVDSYMTFTRSTMEPLMQQWNISEFTMGNEEEYHVDNSSISTTTLQNDLNALAGQVKALGYTGKVSYQTEQGQIANWNALGLRNLDLIGFNVYSSFAAIAASIVSDFGSAGYISEWNPSFQGINGYSSQNYWAADAQNVQKILIASGISRYYWFTYRSDNVYSNGNLDEFAIVTENGLQQYIAQVLGL